MRARDAAGAAADAAHRCALRVRLALGVACGALLAAGVLRDSSRGGGGDGALLAAALARSAPPPLPPASWWHSHCAATMTALRDARPGDVWPPPCPPPPGLHAAFEHAGMPIRETACLAQRYEGARNLSWSKNFVDEMRAGLASGALAGSYGPLETEALRAGLRALPAPVGGTVALVMGTEVPWVEALLLNEGAGLVWTFEYSHIDVQHPRMRAQPCQAIAADFLADRFAPVDLIVSFSSLEHSGLGRYGDALNPDGDRDAIAQAWCLLRPGGLLVLGVPMSCADRGETVFNAHRIYGYERLAYVAANFELGGFVGSACRKELGQPMVVLRKPVDLSAPALPLVAGDFARAASGGAAR